MIEKTDFCIALLNVFGDRRLFAIRMDMFRRAMQKSVFSIIEK